MNTLQYGGVGVYLLIVTTIIDFLCVNLEYSSLLRPTVYRQKKVSR